MRKFQDMVIASRIVRVVASASVLLVSLLVSMTAWGQTAYVTDGSGQDILAVSSGSVSTVATLNKKFGVPTQVRVGSDNLLYVITPTNILRMTTSGANLQTVLGATRNGPTGFTGIRFDSQGNLYANSTAGVYVILGVVQATSSFPNATLLNGSTTSCGGSAGDLAFEADGSLLVACGSAAYRCIYPTATPSLPNKCNQSTSPVVTSSLPITGLAVDSLGDVITSSGSSVTLTAGNASSSVDFVSDVPAYLEAVPDPAGTSAVAPTAFPCNSASPSILVSTANSGKSGKVWRVDTVTSSTVNLPAACSATSFAKPASPLAALNSNSPAVGLAAPATLHTLTKLASEEMPISDFNFGPTSLELSPTLGVNQTSIFTGPCPLSITKEQLPVSYIAGRLANNDANPPVTVSAITLYGEQGWVTGFHGAYPDGCLEDITAFTHIGISGFYAYLNPHIVIIPDNITLPAHVDELPFVYPIAPLNGKNPGDPRITNLGTFTTTPATIIAANVGFPSTAPVGGYRFCGFLSPFTDPATGKKNSNVINSGQSATFKFQLGATSTSCSTLLNPALEQNIQTGFSVAQIVDGIGNLTFKVPNNVGEGNSVTPPKFKFDSTGNVFVYTLDTSGYCNGVYEATANGDIFQPHMLEFTVVGAPSTCQ